jgi:hypothetical protein
MSEQRGRFFGKRRQLDPLPLAVTAATHDASAAQPQPGTERDAGSSSHFVWSGVVRLEDSLGLLLSAEGKVSALRDIQQVQAAVPSLCFPLADSQPPPYIP